MAKKPTILCVDDEKMILVGLKQQLKSHFESQYDLETAENGEEALDILDELLEDHIDVPVVLSDQIMPGMKGDELLKHVHDISPKTLKILLTGQANADAVGKAVNCANLYRYIAKPWERDDLNLTVTEAVRSYFQGKKLEEQNDLLQQLNEKLQKQVDTFFKFVPSQFLQVLHIDNFDHIELAQCVEKEMSVMFADIRSFTSLSEKMTLNENFSFINKFLSEMGPIIRHNQGFIDKYIGDAIMAIYENAEDSVQAAVSMLARLSVCNEKRQCASWGPISIGIGLNTGQLMLGTVGENDRMQTTVIGDMVNLAARLENLTKTYATPILITEYTLEKIEHLDRYSLRLIDKVVVKGKTRPVTVFEIIDTIPPQLNEPKVAIAKLFEEAVAYFHSEDFESAKAIFQECLARCPQDQASHIYLKRIYSNTN